MPVQLIAKSDKRKDWAIVLLALGNAVAWLTGKFADKIPSWVAYVVVGVVAIYYISKMMASAPNPPNIIGAENAVRALLQNAVHGLGSSDGDFHFWNAETQELSITPYAALVGVTRKDRKKAVFLYREGLGVTSKRFLNLSKYVRDVETTDFARRALESRTLNDPVVRKFLSEYGFTENETTSDI